MERIFAFFRCFGGVVWLLFAASSLLTACLEPVSIPELQERAIVVHCILSKDSIQTVRLSYVRKVGEEEDIPVEHAIVRISDGWFSREGVPCGEGVWHVPLTPRSNGQYDLEISVPGRDIIRAATVFPDTDFVVEGEIYQPACFFEEEWAFDELDIYSYLPARCQMVSRELYEEFLGRTRATTLFHSMPGAVFRIIGSGPVYITGSVHSQDGAVSPVRYLATNHLGVDNANVTTSIYRFNDYFEPSGNMLRDKYDKEAFSRYDGLVLHKDYLRIHQQPEYDNGLEEVYTLSVDMFSSFIPSSLEIRDDACKCFVVTGDFPIPVYDKNSSATYPILYFSRVDPLYDRYLQFVYEKSPENKGDFLGSLYADIRDAPTNIEGGYGIFGTIQVQAYRCNRSFSRLNDIHVPPAF
ncbi:MAG: DUF4249 family protein [Bacteroidales bacterium]|nr:DUF4249 family protein [Bacteroidales bacterium]